MVTEILENNPTKEFNLASVLTVATGRLLAPLSDVYGILNFMTSDDLFTHVLPRALRICKPEILIQFPQFDKPEFQFEVGRLIEMLESEEAEPKLLIEGWLGSVAEKYGESFEVKPLDTGDWYSMNPIDEAVEMFGKERVIVAEA